MPTSQTIRTSDDRTNAYLDNIVRAKVSLWEKVGEYSYLGFVGLGPIGMSLLEDAGIDSYWMRILLFAAFMTIIVVFLSFIGARMERKRLAADRENGIFTCAVRFPSSTSGSLREMWDEGAAQVSADGLAVQPQKGPFQAKPAGEKRQLGHVTVLGTAEMTGKKTRGWRRNWIIRELQTDTGRIRLAASPKSLALIEERANRESH